MHMHDFLLPLEAITKRPYRFTLWVLAAVGLGLIGFWFPFVVLPNDGVRIGSVFGQLVRDGVLPSFGIVFASSAIAEAIVGNIANYDDHTAAVLSDLRAIMIMACVVLVVAQTGLFSGSLTDEGYQGNGLLQLIFVLVSLALGCYLYCFRFLVREPVEKHVSEENAETERLGGTAKTADNDTSGVKL